MRPYPMQLSSVTNVDERLTPRLQQLLIIRIFYPPTVQVPQVHAGNGRLKTALRRLSRRPLYHRLPLQNRNYTNTSPKN